MRSLEINTARSALVAGSRGFIARHLIGRLRKDGWVVVEWEDDVRSLGSYEDSVDAVFHLAAVVEHDRFESEPHEAFDANVTGTLAVLNYCQRAQAKCVYASTSAVYEPLHSGGYLSEDSPTKPFGPYAVSKWVGENICFQQSSEYQIPCAVMRIFNVYGPGQRSSFLVPYVLDCLIGHQTMSLRMPEAKRDFVYIDDVTEGLIKASELHTSGYRVYNLGTGTATRVLDLVSEAESIYGLSIGTGMAPAHPGEPINVVADISRAKRELEWSPQFKLNSGLSAIKTQMSLSQEASSQ